MINSKIESLQLLRFIAAMLIVSVHLNFEFGHIGVDIFFVLSGFIIAYVTDKKTQSFFINRLIRIYTILLAYYIFIYNHIINFS